MMANVTAAQQFNLLKKQKVVFRVYGRESLTKSLVSVS